MKQKRTYRKRAAALLAAACMAGGMPQAPVYAAGYDPLAEGVADTADASGGSEAEIVSEGTYTDESGVVFTYQEYADGTACISGMDGYSGKDLAIPAQIGSLRVTEISGMARGSVESLDIPETVAYIGGFAFSSLNIGTLYYNAAEARTDMDGYSPFASARIGNFVLGGSVRSIQGPVFKSAVFLQESLTLSVPVIGDEAFEFAEFGALTLTDGVEEIREEAFALCKIQELHYNTNASHIMENQLGAVFSGASIQALEIGGNVKELPAYAFHWADMCFDELTLRVEKVGDYAFSNAWKKDKGHVLDLTVSDSVEYMGLGAFQHCRIGALELDADVETGDAYHVNGIFSMAEIDSLHISDRVSVVPDYMFDNAYITKDELFLDLEKIGECAFYGENIHIGELTVGERVSSIGIKSFSFCRIGSLAYDAADAQVPGAEYPQDGPFYGTELVSVEIGGSVREVPAYLFREAKLDVAELALPDSVESIGDYAVCGNSLNPGSIRIGTLSIGGNVKNIGEGAFDYISIKKASIHALEAAGGQHAAWGGAPECGHVEIHGGSDYYKYFTKKTDAENIALLCSDFEVSKGEPRYDAEKGCYVTPVTETCVSCSYEKAGEEYEDAHTVVFLGHDGTEISRQHVRGGQDAEPPKAPERPGWRFTGWDRECTGVTADLTVTAQYEICRFTVTFMDGETVLGSQEVEYGSDAQTPADPSRPDEEWGKWKFTGWDGNYAGVSKDETVCAVFEKILNEYEAVFYDADGNVISSQTVKHGGNAETPQAPQKAADSQYTYVFKGWDADTENITADTSFHPVYEAEANGSADTYTVTFMDGGTVLDVQEVESGKDASAPADPTRPDEEWGKWQFAGWKGSYQNVIKNETVYAEFEKILHEYAAVFYDADGKEISRQTVKHGGDAEAPQAPQKAADGRYIYIFKGWDADTKNITSDTSFHPLYETKDCGVTSPGAFRVTFMDGGTVLDVQEVESGKDAAAPADPTRPDEVWGKWRFTGWKGSYQNVTKDETVYAEFEKILNEYEAVFYDADGKEISRQTVKHGGTAELPQAPEKAADSQYRYVFKGWDADTENITSDTSFHPVYEKASNGSGTASTSLHTVTFKDGDKILAVRKVESGKDAAVPADPARPDEAWGKWRFTGWKGSYQNVTKDETVYAQFEKILNEYKAVFYDADGKQISRQTVKHGGKAEAPKAPEKAADSQYRYVFKGWDADTKNITSDTSFHPVYEKVSNGSENASTSLHTVTFKDGDEILAVRKVESGKDAAAPADPARPDEAWGKWRFTGWKGSYQNVTKDETVYAQFEKILNEYKAVFYDADGKEISRQKVKYGGKAEAPKAPEKAADSQYRYVFKGWDADTENITSDTSFHPVYEKVSNGSGTASTSLHTVTFKDGDKILAVRKVESGKDAAAPAEPTRPDEVWGKWRFAGWKGSYQNVTKDETVYAEFKKILNEYEAVFYDADGKEISRQKVKYGGKADTPKAPGKAADSRYQYVFKGWDADTENITSDTGFHPFYESRTRTYTVTFMSGKKVLSVQEVDYGTGASAPSNPVRKADGKHVYIFAGWDADFSFVTEDITVHALFVAEENDDAESKDKLKDKDKNKDKDKDKDSGKDTDTDKNEGSENGADKDRNKDQDAEKGNKGGSGNGSTGSGKPENSGPASGSGTDGSRQPDDGRHPSGGVPATGSGSGTGQPGTGGSRPSGGTAPTERRPDEKQESAPADGEAAEQGENGADTGGKPEKTEPEKGKDHSKENKTSKKASGTEKADGGDTGADHDGKGRKQPGGFMIPLLGVLGAAAAAMSAWLYLWFFRKRRISGTVRNADGSPACGIHVSLAGEDTLETCTDNQGNFCFDGLEKGDWRLEISHSGGRVLLSMNIGTGKRDREEAFRIGVSHCLHVRHMRKRNEYVVNVTL